MSAMKRFAWSQFWQHLKRQPAWLRWGFFWLPSFSGLLVVGLLLVYLYEVKAARPALAYAGVPKIDQAWSKMAHVLRNDAYLVGYSETLKNPLWVGYWVTDQTQSFGKRPRFEADWRTLSYVHYHDFSGSGYNRGHMAPNYLIGSRYGRNAQKQTFLMSNITPQKPQFNQKIWQRLEEVSADKFTQHFARFYVVTGPVFDASPQTLRNRNGDTGIAIPSAFYKIFITETTEGTPSALAFLMPQNAPPNAPLSQYVTSIDAIEARTQIDFFHALPDDVEDQVEAQSSPEDWHLNRYAQLPPRY
ncbi:DNA/RNA endonuclease [Thiomicrospira sp. WB1]|nr:DNA/RNA endonuclease [Thiomicrospira sp. WB1]